MEKEKILKITNEKIDQLINSQQVSNKSKTINKITQKAEQLRQEIEIYLKSTNFDEFKFMEIVTKKIQEILNTQNSANKVTLICYGFINTLNFFFENEIKINKPTKSKKGQ